MTAFEPHVESRGEQAYVCVRRRLRRAELGPELGPRFAELGQWLAARERKPSGPPFFRYLVVDTDQHLEVEAAQPVARPVSGDETVSTGIVPAGRYLVATHIGPYDGLQAVTARLKAWAAEHGLPLAMSLDGTEWEARLETYLTDPSEEPDPARWVTELAIMLAE